jgi:hypothetical protein
MDEFCLKVKPFVHAVHEWVFPITANLAHLGGEDPKNQLGPKQESWPAARVPAPAGSLVITLLVSF